MIAARIATLLIPLLAAGSGSDAGRYFKITVVDEQTGRGVPLVELKTVGAVRYYTDSNGIVAFYEPGLMGRDVFFHVRSHGYEFPKDGFGYRGRALKATEGGSAVLKIKRINIAERLYRVTGGGIYRDSVLVGRSVPLEKPLLNGLVLGQDSVLTTMYRGKVYWFWGDTNRPRYPLGNFQVSGATSLLPRDGGLAPELGVNLHYFVNERGFAKSMAPVPGKGPTWIDGLVTLRDEAGIERLFAAYAKVRADMSAHERGLLEFDDATQQFKTIARFDLDSPVRPGGHPFKHSVRGVEYVYFPRPLPLIRVRADRAHLADLSSYEAFTCLQEGSGFDPPRLDRDEDGTLRYRWKRNTPPVGPQEQAQLIASGHLKPGEAFFHLRDIETGEPMDLHSGSVYWNEYRRRWVLIGLQRFGTSALGEVWYAEADTPVGPWVYARKVVTHDNYSFYNPKQHPMFNQDGGRIIFFEGTYSHTFSGNPDRTPRYDYNQIMYKLDLGDPRLVLPVAIYDVSELGLATGLRPAAQVSGPASERSIAFFAPNRPCPGAVPVFLDDTDPRSPRLTIDRAAPPATPTAAGIRPPLTDIVPVKDPRAPGTREQEPLFYALPPDVEQPPATTVSLHKFLPDHPAPQAYSTDPSWSKPGYKRSKRPLCRVWRNPVRTTIRLP